MLDYEADLRSPCLPLCLSSVVSFLKDILQCDKRLFSIDGILVAILSNHVSVSFFRFSKGALLVLLVSSKGDASQKV